MDTRETNNTDIVNWFLRLIVIQIKIHGLGSFNHTMPWFPNIWLVLYSCLWNHCLNCDLGQQWAILIKICHLTSIGIPMFKIRQSCNCLIFNMRICGYIEMGPWTPEQLALKSLFSQRCHCYLYWGFVVIYNDQQNTYIFGGSFHIFTFQAYLTHWCHKLSSMYSVNGTSHNQVSLPWETWPAPLLNS